MVKSGHAICFGLGPTGDDHVIIKNLTCEINYMKGGGTNYLQRLLIVPPGQVDAIQEAIAAEQDFQWRGRWR